MLRASPLAVPLIAVCTALFAQSPTAPPAAPSSIPEGGLFEVQSLLDAGKLNEAEAANRRFLGTHETSADAHYLLGYILFREGNPRASLAEYTEAARYRAPGVLDLEAIGSNYLLLEDYTAAGKWFTKAVELDPANALARFYLGRAQLSGKQFEEAVQSFTECLKLQPGNVNAADDLGLAYAALGKMEDAEKGYRAALAIDSSASGPNLNLGALLLKSNRALEALPFLVQAVKLAPADPAAHRELGNAYLKLNRPQDARMELAKAREPASLQEIRLLIEHNKLRDSEQLARRFLEAHKDSGDGHFLLGYILFKLEEPKSSLAEYTEGAKYRKPTAADLQAVAGDYVLLKDYPDADKWFTKALEWNPNDALGWYYLGRTKYNENRFDEAVSAFQKCLELDPKNVKAEDNLGLSYEGLGRMDDAMAAYRTAIGWQAASPTKNAGPFLDLGSLLVENDHASDALPYLLDAARLSPEDYRVHRQLGKAYARLNQLEKAGTEFEQAVRLAPENAPIHFMLAQVYRRQGLLDKAKAETERYAKLNASNPPVEK